MTGGTSVTYINLFSQSNKALQPEFKYSKMTQLTGKTTVKSVNNHTLGRGRVRLLQKCLDDRGKDTLIQVFWRSRENNQKLGLIGRFKLLNIIIHFGGGGYIVRENVRITSISITFSLFSHRFFTRS